jgi:hypothetical protein
VSDIFRQSELVATLASGISTYFGFLLLVAAIQKTKDFTSFLRNISALVPSALARQHAAVLSLGFSVVSIELLTGLVLVLANGLWLRAAAVANVVLFVFFMYAVSAAARRHRPCGCFGRSNGRTTVLHIARTLLLLCLSGLLAGLLVSAVGQSSLIPRYSQESLYIAVALGGVSIIAARVTRRRTNSDASMSSQVSAERGDEPRTDYPSDSTRVGFQPYGEVPLRGRSRRSFLQLAARGIGVAIGAGFATVDLVHPKSASGADSTLRELDPATLLEAISRAKLDADFRNVNAALSFQTFVTSGARELDRALRRNSYHLGWALTRRSRPDPLRDVNWREVRGFRSEGISDLQLPPFTLLQIPREDGSSVIWVDFANANETLAFSSTPNGTIISQNGAARTDSCPCGPFPFFDCVFCTGCVFCAIGCIRSPASCANPIAIDLCRQACENCGFSRCPEWVFCELSCRDVPPAVPLLCRFDPPADSGGLKYHAIVRADAAFLCNDSAYICIDWGDGTSPTCGLMSFGSFGATHTYPGPGNFLLYAYSPCCGAGAFGTYVIPPPVGRTN